MNQGAPYLERIRSRRIQRLGAVGHSSGGDDGREASFVNTPEECKSSRLDEVVPSLNAPSCGDAQMTTLPRTRINASATALPARRVLPPRRSRWGGRTFRFNPASFRLKGNASTRRFSITEAAFLLMLASLTSKGLGVIRQTLFNTLFGTGPDATAYYAAFQLPDTLFTLIAGGAFTYAFIPVFLSYEKNHGAYEVWRLTSLVLNVLLVGLSLLVFVGELIAPAFVTHVLVPGLPPAQQALTTSLTRIMLLHSLILGGGTVATAVLNSKRQFLLPALSIAIYDVGLIGGLLVTLAVPKVGIYGQTYGLLASAVCQVAVQLPGLRQQGARYTFLWDLRHPGLKDVMHLLLPNILAVGIAASGSILETSFASYLPDKGSIPALHNASLLFALPLTLVGQVVGQALLPHLTTQATHGRYVRMSQTLLNIVGMALAISLPATLLLYIGGQPAIHLLFQHGSFDAHSTMLTSLALLGYAVGLPGLTASALLILSFYALKDARTPLMTNIVTLIVRISLILFLLRVLSGTATIMALPLAASITGTGEALVLGLLLWTRLRAKAKTDRGLLRLQQRRNAASRQWSRYKESEGQKG